LSTPYMEKDFLTLRPLVFHPPCPSSCDSLET